MLVESLPIAVLEKLQLTVVGTSSGGFTIEAVCGSFRKRYPEEMTFEDALKTAMGFKVVHGLRDDQVLVGVKDIWSSKDRSQGLDKLRAVIRSSPELLEHVNGIDGAKGDIK